MLITTATRTPPSPFPLLLFPGTRSSHTPPEPKKRTHLLRTTAHHCVVVRPSCSPGGLGGGSPKACCFSQQKKRYPEAKISPIMMRSTTAVLIKDQLRPFLPPHASSPSSVDPSSSDNFSAKHTYTNTANSKRRTPPHRCLYICSIASCPLSTIEISASKQFCTTIDHHTRPTTVGLLSISCPLTQEIRRLYLLDFSPRHKQPTHSQHARSTTFAAAALPRPAPEQASSRSAHPGLRDVMPPLIQQTAYHLLQP